MWERLSNRAHSEYCRRAELPQLQSLIAQLACRPYASNVFGYWTHYMLHLSTAKDEQEARQHPTSGVLCVVYLPDEQRFIVGFGETPDSVWSATYRDGGWVKVGRWEELAEVDETLELIDEIVARRVQLG